MSKKYVFSKRDKMHPSEIKLETCPQCKGKRYIPHRCCIDCGYRPKTNYPSHD